MLAILNEQLFMIDPVPVIPQEYRIEYDPEEHRLRLYNGPNPVEFGVIWHAFDGKIHPKSGKIHRIYGKMTRFRAIFGSNHLDFSFPDESGRAHGTP